MENMVQSIDKTTEEGLCTSCGTCVAICPVSCIHFERQKETYLPTIDYEKCIRCGKCLSLCPGYSYTYQTKKEIEPLCFSVQARDRKVLKNASSGGLVTAMIQKLLQNDQYQVAFLVTGYNYENQMETKPFYKGDNLQKSQQSRYLPVSQEKAIKYILENSTERVIFVGTSCAVHGLCNALRAAGRCRDNILILGLFCDQTMTYSIYEYMRVLKKWNSPVKALHFRDKRAGGWPGNLRIEFKNKTHVCISARERMLVKDFCRQRRCLYCMDKLNVEADLSVGDNYTKKNDSIEGSSSLVIRTETGRQVWKYCMEEFWVAISDYQEIKNSQHIEKKLENQLMNNLIFAKRHGGRKIEYSVPYDLETFKLPRDKVEKENEKKLKLQLRELELGEKRAYRLIRKKRFVKFGKMCFNWLFVKLHLNRIS